MSYTRPYRAENVRIVRSATKPEGVQTMMGAHIADPGRAKRIGMSVGQKSARTKRNEGVQQPGGTVWVGRWYWTAGCEHDYLRMVREAEGR